MLDRSFGRLVGRLFAISYLEIHHFVLLYVIHFLVSFSFVSFFSFLLSFSTPSSTIPSFHPSLSPVIHRFINSLLPSRLQVWGGCIGSILLFGVVYWLFTYLSPHYTYDQAHADRLHSAKIVTNASYQIYSCFVQQGRTSFNVLPVTACRKLKWLEMISFAIIFVVC